MIRSFCYKLKPTIAQRAMLTTWLGLTRELYNAALQERRDAWMKQRISVSRYDQQAQLSEIRATRPDMQTVPVIVLRGALRRLDKAFAGFYRRCMTGGQPGYPRFKSSRGWRTLEFDNAIEGNPIVAGGLRVKVPLLGKVKLCLYRPLQGRPRVMRITRYSSGYWKLNIVCDHIEPVTLPITNKSVGIDLGITTLVATSDGDLFKNPKPLAAARIWLEQASRRMSRRKKGSKRWKEAARLLAKRHEHVANIRRQFHINTARWLTARYDTICIENLPVRGLANGGFAKAVFDAGWGQLILWIRSKAESAGREVIAVKPHFTSQICSRCGTKVLKGLKVRIHQCPECGLTIDRDVNAAINIKAAGLAARRGAVALRTPQRPAESHLEVSNGYARLRN